ncbi:MAG: undecaprenyl/decaprenyl-phosphate alpha-N-acetylglucosaminyl 1-phosphate transferase [Erysipelotrichaceae bacterium]|nr:undecaprenyl/decaprenyl-phosphate alpha-N-acetylglucosaminyl 1-phosphate transferase [Erysipelotrichaceae bacterium]
MDIMYFVAPLLLSAILIWPVRMVAKKFNLYAKENKRTIHHGKIPRIGGVAIYLSFMVFSMLFVKENRTFDGLIIGASIVFIGGLTDDIFDIKPIFKIFFQFAATTALVFIGNVYLNEINLPFGIVLRMPLLGYIVTYLWVIGITNALNLIDGLDGLAGGFSIIVLMTIAILTTVIHQRNVFILCLVMAGATMGFLFYNFHPASIFMGDCGSQLLGYFISSIALYGFKSTTFITLGVPIILLFIPIFDTFSAIIRRKLKGESISTPDKSHFHHVLMNGMGLGQVGAVLTIYIVTALFGLTAYLYVYDEKLGVTLLVMLIILFEIFIEYTGMISPKYRPILSLMDRLTEHSKENRNN